MSEETEETTEETTQAVAPADEVPPVVCTECQSRNVRPSQSSYAVDPAKIAGRNLRCWRCDKCGQRVVGPGLAPRSRRSRRNGSRRNDGSTDATSRITRAAKKWIFPLLVILATIFTVVYILDRRNSRPDPSGVAPD